MSNKNFKNSKATSSGLNVVGVSWNKHLKFDKSQKLIYKILQDLQLDYYNERKINKNK